MCILYAITVLHCSLFFYCTAYLKYEMQFILCTTRKTLGTDFLNVLHPELCAGDNKMRWNERTRSELVQCYKINTIFCRK